MIARSHDQEKQVWTFSGEAYVDGMMNGEKMRINSVKPEWMLGCPVLGLRRKVFV
jgi:hypothetical protein